MLETSVILLHYNKNYEIQLVLESFLNQTVPLNTFELIIVDDGSDVSIKKEVEEYQKKGLQIALKENPHTGNRALNRNDAINLVKGENIIILDSDMIPCKTFVEKHNENLSKGEKIVSFGYRRLLKPFPHEMVTPQTVKENFDLIEVIPCMLDERLSMINMHEKIGLSLEGAWYIGYGHNIALKKSLFESIEGFDENFGHGWGGEDIEFVFQLYQAGAKFCFDENICSYHIAHPQSARKTEEYNKNLQYFYEKYKSYEPELFLCQHILDTFSICKLYQQVKNGEHLGEISEEVIKNHQNTLFVGFKNTSDAINENGNKLLSTSDKFAEYNLVGNHVPYTSGSFSKVIINGDYSIFPSEYLYLVIVELFRVCQFIEVYKDSKLISLDEFWQEQTGYSTAEYFGLRKIRVVITPTSDNRQNNILYLELVKALNKNGYYTQLDIVYDDYKDQRNIFPLLHCDSSVIESYYRNVYLHTDSEISIVDKLTAGSIKGELRNLYWWGDSSYYGVNLEKFSAEKKFYKKVLFRTEEGVSLRAGIDSQKINSFISQKHFLGEGIVIADLFLENLELLEEVIEKLKTTEYLRKMPVTILTLNSSLEENIVCKNKKLQVPEYMLQKQNDIIKQMQEAFLQRVQNLVMHVSSCESAVVRQTDGSLEEVDSILRQNSIFIDLSMKKEVNPYVLESAAYGLQVYTTADLYKSYGYENIFEVDFEKINITSAVSTPGNQNQPESSEEPPYIRKMDTEKLISLLLQNKNCSFNFESIKTLNEKNSWSSILQDPKMLDLLDGEKN